MTLCPDFFQNSIQFCIARPASRMPVLIPVFSRDDMEMGVENNLAGIFPIVQSNIIVRSAHFFGNNA